jgi:hypothetical protein
LKDINATPLAERAIHAAVCPRQVAAGTKPVVGPGASGALVRCAYVAGGGAWAAAVVVEAAADPVPRCERECFAVE